MSTRAPEKEKVRTPEKEKQFHLVKVWLAAKRLAIFTLNNALSTSAISRWGLDRIKKKESRKPTVNTEQEMIHCPAAEDDKCK